MLYDYIITNYEKDEPIFLAELPGKSRESVRQEIKKLTDEGKIERLYNGVYYQAYKTILGTKGKVSVLLQASTLLLLPPNHLPLFSHLKLQKGAD